MKHITAQCNLEIVDRVPPYVWEKIKIEACIVSRSKQNPLARRLPCSIPRCDDYEAHKVYDCLIEDYVYKSSEEKFVLTIPGWVRSAASEVLFEGYSDNISISQCVASVISKVVIR